MRSTAVVVAVLAALIILAGCGGGASSPNPGGSPVVVNPGTQPQPPAQPGPPSVGDADSVRNLPVPAGVDPTVWTALTNRLADMLTASGGRATSAAPITDYAKVQVEVNATTATFTWAYRLVGDYNQDGLVSGADLTAIGMYFGVTNPAGGPFPVGSIQWVVDGDRNGEINISDTTPIGVNWGRQITHYNLYSSTSFDDYPLSPTVNNGVGTVFEGTVPFSAAIGDPRLEQLQFSLTVARTEPQRFYWLRPADADSQGTPSNVVSVGGLPGNQPPVASFTTAGAGGTLPTNVNFDASASFDPDGLTGTSADIVQYEWDFNGDGLFDLATLSPTASHLYLVAGTYNVRLRVIDRGGAFSLSTGGTSITIGPGSGNAAPVAALIATPAGGEAPLNVVFDASASSDDGPQSALRFDWDIDNDGTYEHSTGGTPFVTQAFTLAGSYTVGVRITDAGGLTDTASATVTATPRSDPSLPGATITVDGNSGTAPFTVNFTFGSSANANCPVTKYEADWDGDGTYDASWTTNPGTVSHTYTVAGNYTARLRVTDSCGGSGEGTAVIVVQNPDDPDPPVTNQAPTASLVLTKISRHGPNAYKLDASGSSDADGSIVKYEWDFDGDGVWDADSFTNSVVWHLYWNMATFTPVVRVTDNDGATDTATAGGITTDWGWHSSGHGHGWWHGADGCGCDDDSGHHGGDDADKDKDGHDNGINGNDDDEGHDDDGHAHHDGDHDDDSEDD